MTTMGEREAEIRATLRDHDFPPLAVNIIDELLDRLSAAERVCAEADWPSAKQAYPKLRDALEAWREARGD